METVPSSCSVKSLSWHASFDRLAELKYAFSPCGRYVATFGFDGKVMIRDLRDMTLVSQISCPVKKVLFAFSADSRELISVDPNGVIKVYMVQSGELVSSTDTNPSKKPISRVSFSADRNTVLMQSKEVMNRSVYYVYDRIKEVMLSEEKFEVSSQGRISPDGTKVGIMGEAGEDQSFFAVTSVANPEEQYGMLEGIVACLFVDNSHIVAIKAEMSSWYPEDSPVCFEDEEELELTNMELIYADLQGNVINSKKLDEEFMTFDLKLSADGSAVIGWNPMRTFAWRISDLELIVNKQVFEEGCFDGTLLLPCPDLEHYLIFQQNSLVLGSVKSEVKLEAVGPWLAAEEAKANRILSVLPFPNAKKVLFTLHFSLFVWDSETNTVERLDVPKPNKEVTKLFCSLNSGDDVFVDPNFGTSMISVAGPAMDAVKEKLRSLGFDSEHLPVLGYQNGKVEEGRTSGVPEAVAAKISSLSFPFERIMVVQFKPTPQEAYQWKDLKDPQWLISDLGLVGAIDYVITYTDTSIHIVQANKHRS